MPRCGGKKSQNAAADAAFATKSRTLSVNSVKSRAVGANWQAGLLLDQHDARLTLAGAKFQLRAKACPRAKEKRPPSGERFLTH